MEKPLNKVRYRFFPLALFVLGVTTPVRANLCQWVSDILTRGRVSRKQVEVAEDWVKEVLAPTSSRDERVSALKKIAGITNYKARAAAMKSLIGPMLSKGSPLHDDPGLMPEFIEMLQGQASASLVALHRDAVLPLSQREDLIASLRWLFAASNTIGCALAEREGGNRQLDRTALLDSLNGNVFRVMPEVAYVSNFVLHSRSISDVENAVDVLLEALKKEARGQNRVEVQLLLEEALRLCHSRLERWMGVDSVAQRISKMTDVIELMAFQGANERANIIGRKIRAIVGEKSTESELLRKIQKLRLKNPGASERRQLDTYEKWAKSGLPELTRCARLGVGALSLP